MNTQSATARTRAVTNLDSLLGPGERVLWRGKPVRRDFVFRTWPLSVFGLVLVVAVFAFEVVVLTTEAPRLAGSVCGAIRHRGALYARRPFPRDQL